MATHNDNLDRQKIWEDFRQAVNMTPRELRDWLETEESQSVGWRHEGDIESVGHKSGRRIVEIKGKKRSELDDHDLRTHAKSGWLCPPALEAGWAGARSAGVALALLPNELGSDPMKD